ncbi:MAG: tRNA (adenosine(37)-N6)-threonylcarbamoyltransferase complex dimerization subunit type 1 TsaB [Xanthomarina gelatinilytica]|uniref:tRNA (adenosine(37)-N6)-threonylcarbamoyltransferase complex dimerization subunit type 1 TsaB n=1 Tax=Xanthomarina gelatinilytica TaxID=1137281 RepID=UPI003A8AF81D
MAIILSVETSTTNCSVSLSKQGETFALLEDNSKDYSHAERLHVYMERLLAENNLQLNQLDAIAVSKGPGSYTGLRIGVSAAKGLCFALNKPLISVSTLEALAHQVIVEKGLIIPMLDARRMEVYSGVFDANYQIIRQVEAQILDANAFAEYLETGQVFFLGNGVEKSKSIIQHPHAHFIDNKLPSANQMSQIAYRKFQKSDFEDVAYFEPYYLKDFVVIKSNKK